MGHLDPLEISQKRASTLSHALGVGTAGHLGLASYGHGPVPPHRGRGIETKMTEREGPVSLSGFYQFPVFGGNEGFHFRSRLPVLWRHGTAPLRGHRGEVEELRTACIGAGIVVSALGNITRRMRRDFSIAPRPRLPIGDMPSAQFRSQCSTGACAPRLYRLVVPQTDIPRSLNEPCRAGFLALFLEYWPIRLGR